MNTARLINDRFNYEITEMGDKTHVKLIGSIDEDTDLTPLLKLKNSSVVFHFQEINSINSCGIRTWVNFIREFGGSIEFQECPPLIVRQMNMVPSFLGKARVDSVFVPYVCDGCDNEEMVLVSVEEYKKGTPVPETTPCNKCQSQDMEMDGNVKQYFAFSK